MLSTLYGGFLGDKFGRKFTAMILIVLYLIVSVLTVFAPTIESLLFLRVLTGLCQGPVFSLIYLIMVECVNKHVTLIAYIAQFFYAVGEVLAVFTGYFLCYSWELQIILFSLVLLSFVVLTLFLLPESPRWLYCEGKREEAVEILRWFAKLNHKDEDIVKFGENQEVEDLQFLIPKQKPEVTSSFSHLLGTSRGFMTFMTHALTWISIGFIYAGLLYGAQGIGSDFYVVSSLLASSESLVVLLYPVVTKYGNKRPLQVCLICATFACYIVPFTGMTNAKIWLFNSVAHFLNIFPESFSLFVKE